MNYLPKRYLNQEPKALAEKTFKDRIAVLAIAYHNLAVEQEFLKLVINLFTKILIGCRFNWVILVGKGVCRVLFGSRRSHHLKYDIGALKS